MARPPIFLDQTFEAAAAVAQAGGRLLLVDVTAEWCQPCKHMDQTTWVAPEVAQWFSANAVAVQIDAETEAAKRLKVQALPTVVVLRNGKELDRVTGARPAAALLAWLDGVREGKTELDRLRATPRSDLSARLSLARTLVLSGLDSEATEEFLWLWEHSLEVDKAWVGVRHSFLIAALTPLVRRSDEARRPFEELRSAAQGDLEKAGAFGDWVTLSNLLGEEDRLLAWLDQLDADTATRLQIFRNHTLLEIIEKRGAWKTLGRIISDPMALLHAENERAVRSADALSKGGAAVPKEMLERTALVFRQMLRSRAAGLVHALEAVGRSGRRSCWRLCPARQFSKVSEPAIIHLNLELPSSLLQSHEGGHMAVKRAFDVGVRAVAAAVSLSLVAVRSQMASAQVYSDAGYTLAPPSGYEAPSGAGSSGAAACVPQSAPCTTTYQCCGGLACLQVAGSAGSYCEPPPSAPCGINTTYCPAGAGSTTCVTTRTDPANCGGCGIACPPGDVCTGGTCVSSTDCPQGFVACGGPEECVDPLTNSSFCSTTGGCGSACPSGEGCASGRCVPTVTLTSSTGPAYCQGSYLPLAVVQGDGAVDCTGNLSQQASSNSAAICSCAGATLSSTLTSNSYNSLTGPYLAGGSVGQVLVNDALTGSGILTIGGDLDVGSNLTLSSRGNYVDRDLFVGGALTVSGSLAVAQNAVVYGRITGNVTVAGTLSDAGGFPSGSSSGATTSSSSSSSESSSSESTSSGSSSRSIGSTSSGTSSTSSTGSSSGSSSGGTSACVPQAAACTPTSRCCAGLTCTISAGAAGASCLPDPPPVCNCNNPIDIAGIVANGATQNDNASIGLNDSVLANNSTATHLDLPCGEYYLTAVKSSAALSIGVHGNTVLYVGGSIQASAPLEITIDPTAQLNLFVAGSIVVSAATELGSAEVPAQATFYVGGSAGVTASGTLEIAGTLYLPNGPFKSSSTTSLRGSLLANGLTGSGPITAHYDLGELGAGIACAAPASEPFTVSIPAEFRAGLEDPAQWFQTPSGGLIHPSCFHVLPAGSALDGDGNVTDNATGAFLGTLPPCLYPIWGGAASRSATTAPTGDENCSAYSSTACWADESSLGTSNIGGMDIINLINGTVTVPNPPPLSTTIFGLTPPQQLVYMFNSIQSNDAILQPVLQYGSFCQGESICGLFCAALFLPCGGPWFQMTNWAHGGPWGPGAQTETNVVSVGDTIISYVDLTSPTQYDVGYFDSSLGPSSVDFFINLTGNAAGEQFTSAQPSVLEFYHVMQCSELPSSPTYCNVVTDYIDTFISQAGPEWDSENPIGTDATQWVPQGLVFPNLTPACGFADWNWNSPTPAPNPPSVTNASYLLANQCTP